MLAGGLEAEAFLTSRVVDCATLLGVRSPEICVVLLSCEGEARRTVPPSSDGVDDGGVPVDEEADDVL